MSAEPLVWYDGQESGIELGELWDLLERHGFVDVPMAHANSLERARVEGFAADLHAELVRSEVERMRVPPPGSCAELEDEP